MILENIIIIFAHDFNFEKCSEYLKISYLGSTFFYKYGKEAPKEYGFFFSHGVTSCPTLSENESYQMSRCDDEKDVRPSL